MDKFKCPITQEVIRDPLVASGEGEGREGGGGREILVCMYSIALKLHTHAGELNV